MTVDYRDNLGSEDWFIRRKKYNKMGTNFHFTPDIDNFEGMEVYLNDNPNASHNKRKKLYKIMRVGNDHTDKYDLKKNDRHITNMDSHQDKINSSGDVLRIRDVHGVRGGDVSTSNDDYSKRKHASTPSLHGLSVPSRTESPPFLLHGENGYAKKRSRFRGAWKESLDAPQKIHPSDEKTKSTDLYLHTFTISSKKGVPLNKNDIENSNLELKNKLNHSLNPTLSLVASRAVDGLLGGVHKHMQGPFSLDLDGTHNSPLAPQIVTPNLYSNVTAPFNMRNGMPPSGAPTPPANPAVTAPPTASAPNAAPAVQQTTANVTMSAPPNAQPPVAAAGGTTSLPPGVPIPPNGMSYPQVNMPNLMSANQIAQNPAFNIHPTGTSLRDDPGNVNYNEVVTITIGIVICLFLFCFIFGCLIKMCKPKKRRR
ncbi:conserved Plasmodium protein, unknown function [Plasmodium ovale]|uniref:Uncharacterized protein n=1 Tax=Plasmodium ovale TaxID=36330 RepID=A0A1C3KSD3_PLAOA|nr:conserved Plasmodium protein, unknown function [Plasmodium ovale]